MFVSLLARLLHLRRSKPAPPDSPAILVIRRNRMGDMICTLPLFKAIRAKFPKCRLVVACDGPGAPIARACPHVDAVIVLTQKSLTGRYPALIHDALRLQGFDIAIAVKGGFDYRLACLVRLSNAYQRIGFALDRKTESVAFAKKFYTHALLLPETIASDHQVETQHRLLEPLGISDAPGDPELPIPQESRDYADAILRQPPFVDSRGQRQPFVLINLACNRVYPLTDPELITFIQRILNETPYLIGLVSGPVRTPACISLLEKIASPRVIAVETPRVLDLAGFLIHATGFVAPEGGTTHLSALTNTPAIVLWSEGNFNKWRSRCTRHSYVTPAPPRRHIEASVDL